MMENPFLAIANAAVSIDRNMLWVALGIFFAVYATISAVLMYHWQRYGMNSRKIALAQIVYFIISIALFSMACLIVIS